MPADSSQTQKYKTYTTISKAVTVISWSHANIRYETRLVSTSMESDMLIKYCMQKLMCTCYCNKLPMPRILGFFFFSGEATAAEASAERCSMGGDVMSHSSAAVASASLPSSFSGVSAKCTPYSIHRAD